MPCHRYTQDAEYLICTEAGRFDIRPHGRLASFVTDSGLLRKDLVRPSSDLCALFRIESLRDQIFGGGRNILLEEKAAK